MVGVAQLVRAPDCGSGGRGFESRYPPQYGLIIRIAQVHWRSATYGPLAQLVEQGTLNPKVIGSIPIRPTMYFPRPSSYADGGFVHLHGISACRFGVVPLGS